MAAIDDKLLADCYEEITKQFPKVKFRKCPVDLSQGDYIDVLDKATKDIHISILCNNAGYITTGFFADLPLERSLRNYECNASAPLKITHHFLNKMIESKKKGFITFTSSSAGFIPGPLSSLYCSTKSFLTLYGSSLAAEVKPFGIDVLIVHPSPIASRFLTNSGGVKMLEMSGKVAAPPSVIADSVFACAGRCVVRDQVYYYYYLFIILNFIILIISIFFI